MTTHMIVQLLIFHPGCHTGGR